MPKYKQLVEKSYLAHAVINFGAHVYVIKKELSKNQICGIHIKKLSYIYIEFL